MPLDLVVIIVTWNVRDLVLEALRSLHADLATSGLTYAVHVVDSASSDGTADAVRAEFPSVQLAACQENVGFVGGNNLALRALGFGMAGVVPDNLPRAVYLLNPDTITHTDATRTLFDALMLNKEAGLVGARLTYADGSFQHSAFAFPGLRQLWAELLPTPGRLIESRFNGRYPRALYERSQPFPVDFVLGATMMLKREAISETGIFDERFYMYCEEIDWAWRLHDAGWGVCCVPDAHVTHIGGASTGQVKPQTVLRLWTSRLLLFDKHYPVWKRIIAGWMVWVGTTRKMAMLRRTSASPDRDLLIDAYQQVRKMTRK